MNTDEVYHSRIELAYKIALVWLRPIFQPCDERDIDNKEQELGMTLQPAVRLWLKLFGRFPNSEPTFSLVKLSGLSVSGGGFLRLGSDIDGWSYFFHRTDIEDDPYVYESIAIPERRKNSGSCTVSSFALFSVLSIVSHSISAVDSRIQATVVEQQDLHTCRSALRRIDVGMEDLIGECFIGDGVLLIEFDLFIVLKPEADIPDAIREIVNGT